MTELQELDQKIQAIQTSIELKGEFATQGIYLDTDTDEDILQYYLDRKAELGKGPDLALVA